MISLTPLAEAEANYWSASLRYQQLKPMAAKLQVDFLHHHSLEPHDSNQHLKAVANILCNERQCESYQVVCGLKGVAPMTTVFTGDIYPQLMILHWHSKDRSLLRVAGNAIFWPSKFRFLPMTQHDEHNDNYGCQVLHVSYLYMTIRWWFKKCTP